MRVTVSQRDKPKDKPASRWQTVVQENDVSIRRMTV